MTSTRFNQEIRELMLRHLEGETTPEEARHLEIVLRNSPTAQQEYAELLVQTVQLRSIGQEREIEFLDESDRVKASRGRNAMRWVAAVAASLAIAATVWFFLAQREPGRLAFEGIPDATADVDGVATLIGGAGVVWEREVNAQVDVGTSLSAGRLRLKQGVVQVRFRSGAEVILEGPAEFRIISGHEAALRHGRLSARVPPEARGFVVHSAEAQVVDLGTEFGLNRRPGGTLEVHVFSGEVEFARSGSERTSALTTGEAAEIQPQGVRSIRSDPMAFVSEERLRQREFTELHERFQAWKRASEALAKDPATLVHLDFQQNEDDRRVWNRAPGSRSVGGDILGCDWTEGRWPHKKALRFEGAGDKVQFIVPGVYSSLSYVTWVRVNQLENVFNALSLSERRIPGAVHWQIMNDGGVEFSVRSVSARPESLHQGWDRLLTRPLIGPETLGQWVHLAAVYDGPRRTMSVYVNGQLAQWKTIQEPMRLIPGEVGLGNWHPPDLASRLTPSHPDYKMYVLREFRGELDEFTILARPLSADEVRTHYEVGKPSSSTHALRLRGREGSDQLRVRETRVPAEETGG